MTGLWFSPGIPISSTNKTDCHNIAEILLIVALNTITITLNSVVNHVYSYFQCRFYVQNYIHTSK